MTKRTFVGLAVAILICGALIGLFFNQGRIRRAVNIKGGLRFDLEAQGTLGAGKDAAMRQALEILENRIGQFGVARSQIVPPDPGGNRIIVKFFNLGRRFETLTELAANEKRPIAVILDGKLLMTFMCLEPISSGAVWITTPFSRLAAEDLALKLSGSGLQAHLKLLGQRPLGPSLRLGATEIGLGPLLFGFIALACLAACARQGLHRFSRMMPGPGDSGL